jgi:hypothetical protein
MALTITHAKVSTAGPSADPDKVGGDDWNDDHVLTGDYLRKATVTLSSAQLLDLHNTPVTLVAAPGAGKFIAWSHTVVSTTGTTGYSTTDSWPRVAYTDGGANTASATFVDALAAGGKSLVYTPATTPIDTPEDLPLLLTDNGESELTGGDIALRLVIWYSIEDVPA